MIKTQCPNCFGTKQFRFSFSHQTFSTHSLVICSSCDKDGKFHTPLSSAEINKIRAFSSLSYKHTFPLGLRYYTTTWKEGLPEIVFYSFDFRLKFTVSFDLEEIQTLNFKELMMLAEQTMAERLPILGDQLQYEGDDTGLRMIKALEPWI